MASRGAESEVFRRRFLLATVTLVTILFLWMILDFVAAVLLAAVFAGLLNPIYRWLVARTGGRAGLSAGIVVVASLLLIFGPVGLFIGLVTAQAIELSQNLAPWVEAQLAESGGIEGEVQSWIDAMPYAEELPRLETLLPERGALIAKAGEAISAGGAMVVSGFASLTRNTALFLLNLFILLYALAFFLIQGRELLERIFFYVPLHSNDERAVVDRFLSVTRATLKGSIVIGALQGTLAGLAFWVAGIQGALFWGTVMAILSVIPGVGSLLVWAPAALFLMISGRPLAGMLLAAWCAVVVGSIDNLLRPRLVGADAKMSDLMILLGTLGGISLFGVVGVLIGPIVAALFVTAWELYGNAFRDVLPPVGKE
jgi:predicted PurR-regulated permease PerM